MPFHYVGFRPPARRHELVQAQCVMGPRTVTQIPDRLGVIEPRLNNLDQPGRQRNQPQLTHGETVQRGQALQPAIEDTPSRDSAASLGDGSARRSGAIPVAFGTSKCPTRPGGIGTYALLAVTAWRRPGIAIRAEDRETDHREETDKRSPRADSQ